MFQLCGKNCFNNARDSMLSFAKIKQLLIRIVNFRKKSIWVFMATDFLHILIGLPTLASCSFMYVVIKRWFEKTLINNYQGNQGWEKEEISQATLVLKLSKWFIYQRKSVRGKYIQSITIVPKASGKDSRKQLKYDDCSIGPFGPYVQLTWRFS